MEGKQAITGHPDSAAMDYFTSKLDPKVFHGLQWSIANSESKDTTEANKVRLFFNMGGVLMEAKNTRLTVAELNHNRGQWEAKSKEAMALTEGQFYAVTKNADTGESQYWVWKEAPTTAAERIKHIGNALMAGLLDQEIINGGVVQGGLFHDRVVAALSSVFERILGAIHVFGFPIYAENFFARFPLERIRYKILLHSEHGGWIRGDRIHVIKAPGKDDPIKIWILKEGIFIERHAPDEKGRTILLSLNGTPAIRISHRPHGIPLIACSPSAGLGRRSGLFQVRMPRSRWIRKVIIFAYVKAASLSTSMQQIYNCTFRTYLSGPSQNLSN